MWTTSLFFSGLQKDSGAEKTVFDAFPANQFVIFANFSFVKKFLRNTTEKLFAELTEYSVQFLVTIHSRPERYKQTRQAHL